MPKENGLLRPFPKELTDRAKSANTALIAALAVPFPDHIWRMASADLFSRADLDEWAENAPLDDIDPHLKEAFSPWKALAKRLNVDDGGAGFQREVRSLLQLLLAAEAIDSPFLYLTTIVGCFPTLQALFDFATHAPTDEHDVNADGCWLGNLSKGFASCKSIFREVFDFPFE